MPVVWHHTSNFPDYYELIGQFWTPDLGCRERYLLGSAVWFIYKIKTFETQSRSITRSGDFHTLAMNQRLEDNLPVGDAVLCFFHGSHLDPGGFVCEHPWPAITSFPSGHRTQKGQGVGGGGNPAQFVSPWPTGTWNWPVVSFLDRHWGSPWGPIPQTGARISAECSNKGESELEPTGFLYP